MKILKNLTLILLLVLPLVVLIAENGSGMVARAEEDEIETEEDGGVEDEGEEGNGEPSEEEPGVDVPDEEEPASAGSLKNVSPDIDTTILFTRPTQLSAASTELPAGKIVEFLVGFSNKGDGDFVIETLDASFRYPMDFTFHIQNFSAVAYQKTVKPKEEATIAYSFVPADAFAGRPIGLSINLAYRDLQGNYFFDPVFNETVQIVEFDEGFDSEVFFMYIFLVAAAIIVIFLAYTFLAPKSSKKKSGPSSRPVETGTTNDDVDYEWIPKHALRTPGSSKTSPRQRRNKDSAAAGSDSE